MRALFSTHVTAGPPLQDHRAFSLSHTHPLTHSERVENFFIMANSAFKSAMSNSKMRAMAKLSEMSRLVSISDTSEATVG